MPDGKTMLIILAAGLLVAGAGKVGRGVGHGTVATKNAAVKVFRHIHPKGAAKAVVNHQK